MQAPSLHWTPPAQAPAPSHEMSRWVAVHHTPAAQEAAPAQSMWQVTSKPPQLMRSRHVRGPEQTRWVWVAPPFMLPGQEPSPLQVMAHVSPSQYAWAQLPFPEHVMVVLTASLLTLLAQAPSPAQSMLQVLPLQST